MLLDTLGVSLLGNLLTVKGTRPRFLMPPHPLTNFLIQKYYQSQPKFNGAYSRNNLPKIKDGAHVINLDKFKSIETHWIALYVNGNNSIYYNSFGVEHIPKKRKRFIRNKIL